MTRLFSFVSLLINTLTAMWVIYDQRCVLLPRLTNNLKYETVNRLRETIK